MKPFLTPHASVRRPQRTAPAQTVPPATARSTVLLSILLAPRQAQSARGPRNR
jgi:hypothetical protein